MDVFGAWISVFLTLAIFSFLYRDNPIYKFAEHLFVGVSAGYGFIQAIMGTLIPNLYLPLKQSFCGVSYCGWTRLGALVLAILLLLRLVEKVGWLSRLPLALIIGMYAALRLLGHAQSDLVLQVNGTMLPLAGRNLPWLAWSGASVLNNALLMLGVLSVLIYFFFSVEHKRPLKQIALVGTFFLMVTFGSSFGFTVLGRISLLIGRVQVLYKFAGKEYGYASVICGLCFIIWFVIWGRLRKKTVDASPTVHV
jgi:hypothetical protein